MKRKQPLALREVSGLPALPDVNEEIFERAGISKDDRALLLKRVFDRTTKRLGATHVKVFQSEGDILYSKPLVDHGTQGKAIDQALQLVNLQKQDAPRVTIKLQVKLPDYALTDKPKEVNSISETIK